MIKEIYLIRHGQTEMNKLGFVQGSIDTNLDETGRKQAEDFFKTYQDVPFDKIYTSKLKRTKQSLDGFIQKGIPFQQLYGLNEISWGEKEGRALTDADNDYYNQMIEEWDNGNYDFPAGKGGESPAQVQSRQITAWEYLMSNMHEERILVAMHGRAIRILLSYLMDTPLSEMNQYKHQNLCLYIIQYDTETDEYTIVEANKIDHLQNSSLPI
ncbi:histidine phosphatase family protein [Sediminitomix flava]|uniref:Putative phosphoglycerate mutase n=1 Tax=Sediminitomix flava TaxID=379075 RepID=A0A315Z9X3_SEDFL|nr:histidine phosphatase family protein [Sediminitomix flava]PWJ40870.1 putative phosphoglycerate mutase [Sediminitomix flava]